MTAASPTPQQPPPSPSRLKADSYWSRLALHQVPASYLLVTAFTSYFILGVCYLQGVNIAIAFGIAMIPWVVIAFFEIKWSYKHFHWFALFTFMVFVQTIHYSEHCIQVIQVHFFDVNPHKAQAIFSRLNIEGVHFVGDTLLTIGTLALLYKFPRNPWLWVALPFQIIHEAEHLFLMFNYVFEGVPVGGPGLLAKGGAIGGGLPLIRADLHWIYNTLYTIPFVLSLIYQLKRTYDEALDEAFPEAPKSELVAASQKLESFEYRPAETVLAAGDDADRMYIVTEGEASVIEHNDAGGEREVDTLHHGQTFGAIGLLVPGASHPRTIRAKTPLRVLAMDGETFRHLVAVSELTHEELAKTVAQGDGAPAGAGAGPGAGAAPAPAG
jgi:hypothetical protein